MALVRSAAAGLAILSVAACHAAGVLDPHGPVSAAESEWVHHGLLRGGHGLRLDLAHHLDGLARARYYFGGGNMMPPAAIMEMSR
jgi:hypothetical protein